MAIAVTALALALALADAPPPAGFRHWGSFELRTSRDVRVRLLIAEGRGPPRWAAEKTERDADGRERRQWADGAACPALAELPASLAALQPIAVGTEIPIVEETPSGPILRVTADGPSYAIEAPAAFQRDWAGRVRLESGEGPVQAWVVSAVARLAPCWTDRPLP